MLVVVVGVRAREHANLDRLLGRVSGGRDNLGLGLTPVTYCKYSMFHGLQSTFNCYYSIYIFVPSDLFGCRQLSSYLPTTFSILARS